MICSPKLKNMTKYILLKDFLKHKLNVKRINKEKSQCETSDSELRKEMKEWVSFTNSCVNYSCSYKL